MLPFVLKRCAWAVVLLLVISLITFILFFVLPAAPLGRGRLGTEDVSIRDAFEFTGPIYHEYWQFVSRLIFEQDLGRSLSTRVPVTTILMQAAPVTGWLILGGLLLMLSIAVPLGILAAVRPRTFLDRSATIFVVLGISAHPAWIGLILAYVFGFRLDVLPVSGYCDLIDPSTDCGGPRQWLVHMLLPWFTFSLIFAAMYTRMIRASMIEVLHEDYVRTARAKGVPERDVLRHHVLRNALMPVVTMLALDAAGLAGLGLTAIIFVERVYGLPGLGGLVLEGLQRRDPPVVLGVVIFMSTAIVIFNLIADVLYTFIDPRLREAEMAQGSLLRRRAAREAAPAAAQGLSQAANARS